MSPFSDSTVLSKARTRAATALGVATLLLVLPSWGVAALMWANPPREALGPLASAIGYIIFLYPVEVLIASATASVGLGLGLMNRSARFRDRRSVVFSLASAGCAYLNLAYFIYLVLSVTGNIISP